MPTFNTANYLQQSETRTYAASGGAVTSSPSRLATANVASGTVEFAIIPHILSTEAAADVINLCLLPAGAIPIPALSKCVCATDPGTAFTVKVGTAVSSTGYAAAVAMTVAGDVPFCLAGATQPDWLVATPIAADTGSGNAVVFATVVTATAITATTVMYFVLAFKRAR